MELREAWDVCRQQRLGVLNAEAAVAGVVLLFKALVEVEDGVVGAVADGVGDELQPGFVGELEAGEHLLRVAQLVRGDAVVGRIVRIGLCEPGGGCAEAAIGKAFKAADVVVGITEAGLDAEVGELAAVVEG